jgi:hypothetical protein
VQPRLGWSRRIGIVIALLALGGTVVLAGGFGTRGAPQPVAVSASPRRTLAATPTLRITDAPAAATPHGAPSIAKPATEVTTDATWDARVTLTTAGIPRNQLTLRIYRNDTMALEVPVRAGRTMLVRDIPLEQGLNAISAAFVASGGEGPRSAGVSLTLDDIPPEIALSDPVDHAVINAPLVTLRGQTEPEATVTVQNLSSGARLSTATADAQGRFQVGIGLTPGGNDLEITARDKAGNTARAARSITRGAGVADVQLSMTRTSFRVRSLPATFDVTLLVTDASGLAVDRAPVTFSLSPPGLPTSTFQATTELGHAAWLAVTLPEGLQVGSGFVTARVTLPDGATLQQTTTFTVR